MIDSPEIAGQLGEFMDEGVAPGSAYHVTLDDDGDLVWTTETERDESGSSTLIPRPAGGSAS